MQELSKYTLKSRDIVKKSLRNAHYVNLIDSLQEMVTTELDTCNHLRSLKIDENLPRNKQKSQAKSILNQKRKALTDFFKNMTSLGVSYKTGLLTSSLNSELVDLKISPFNVGKLNLLSDDGKADLYFNKSIFKMKLLTNILLSPHANLDYGFLERIKGFSVELFTLVQTQRENLSENVNRLGILKKFIENFENIKKCEKSQISFEREFTKMEIVRKSFIEACEKLEQFKLLMKCAPESDNSNEHKAVISSQNIFFQKSKIYREINLKIDEILADLNVNFNNEKFVINCNEMVSNLIKVVKKLEDLKEYFKIDDEYSVYGLPICELYEKLYKNVSEIKSVDEKSNEIETNLEEDFNKLSHSILLSIQNIYKEYRELQAEEEDPQNQLKEKLHLKLINDLKILSLPQINSILSKITNSLYKFCDENSIKMLSAVYPLIKQFKLLTDFFVIQQFNAHRLCTKMLSIMLSVFLELAKNGFCVPEHLLSDEEQKEELDKKPGEGFGFEDGTGEKDVSDKLESEDQLDEAKRPEDHKKGDQEENKECKEEKGIEMSDNFDGKMHDVPEDGSDAESDNEDDKEEMDKEMGDTGEGAEKLDDQIWGSDDENEPEENDKEDETGENYFNLHLNF
jgi:midasin